METPWQWFCQTRKQTRLSSGKTRTVRSLSSKFLSNSECNPELMRKRLCRHHKKGSAFTDAPDGVYTWIIYTNEEGALEVYAGKLRTNQETGTLHQNLHMCSARAIVFAGELVKKDHEIIFNLQSGTYMAKKFTPFERILTIETKTGKALSEAIHTNKERSEQNKHIHASNMALRDTIIHAVTKTFADIHINAVFNMSSEDAEYRILYGGIPIIEGLEIINEENGSTNRSIQSVYS